MKISCPACSAKYSIADDKVQERLAKIRCRKCGATIVIDGKTSPPNVYTAAGDSAEVSAPPAAADGGTEYSIDFGEGDQRNMPVREIVAAYKAGQITTETYVWADGFSDWKPLSEVPELAAAVSGGGAGAPSPWDARPTAQRSSQLPRTTQGAARTGGNRPSGDLFGGVSRAGNEDDVATSAPEQPSGAGGSGTGARNESSVLFSLSALTAGATNQRPSARPPAATTSSKDDSGLIDLKALTAAAVKSDTGAMAMPAVPAIAPLTSPLGVAAPLGGFGSPLGGGVATGADIEPKKSKTPIIIAALLCVGMLAVAAAIVLKPAPPPPPAPVVIAAPPAPTPAPTPEPIAAAPPATGTADAAAAPDASGKPAAVARGSAPRSAPRSTGKSSGTSSGASTKKEEPKSSAPAAPKSSNCGCGPADLQCAMRCAAKKK